MKTRLGMAKNSIPPLYEVDPLTVIAATRESFPRKAKQQIFPTVAKEISFHCFLGGIKNALRGIKGRLFRPAESSDCLSRVCE
jgi:hypothetical protein